MTPCCHTNNAPNTDATLSCASKAAEFVSTSGSAVVTVDVVVAVSVAVTVAVVAVAVAVVRVVVAVVAMRQSQPKDRQSPAHARERFSLKDDELRASARVSGQSNIAKPNQCFSNSRGAETDSRSQ